MKAPLKNRLFKKVLVPVVYGCDQNSAISAARAIAGEENVVLVGLIYIPEGESLSTAALPARDPAAAERAAAGGRGLARPGPRGGGQILGRRQRRPSPD